MSKQIFLQLDDEAGDPAFEPQELRIVVCDMRTNVIGDVWVKTEPELSASGAPAVSIKARKLTDTVIRWSFS